MLSFERIYNLSNKPTFEDPLFVYPDFGVDLEAIAAKQGIKFGETGLFPPLKFENDGNPHFEYRLYKGATTLSEYEPINFDYFPDTLTLRVYSNIPEIKAKPIVAFIAEHYLHVRLLDPVDLPPDEDEAIRVLNFLKAVRKRTNDWFTSIIENRGAGTFRPDEKRPFKRSLLFLNSEVDNLFQIYTPNFLKEIRRTYSLLWKITDNDTEAINLSSFITDFNNEWIDFFANLANITPKDCSDLISDFESAGLDMFKNLESSIISGNAKTPKAEEHHKTFLEYLPREQKSR